ncbi:MAG: 4-hydroxythreonine-4-phosphate dehydrogenase PdxA [Kiritimatiellales bacterium]|nr:4-hydroxythreonine-4-phosphate dehydrogenase PdxA [Kiritimatiellales bacterium]
MSIRIGITCGDVNGIGPEIARKAVSKVWNDVEFVLIGPAGDGTWNIPFNGNITPGKITAEASRTAVAAIERAVRGCLDGELDAMVTAPICKEGLKRAGVNYPGHTEMIAELTGTKRYGMMLMGKGLRVTIATRHLPLREVADALTKENILEAIELTGEALDRFGFKNGRIGVCGLNPHAGDGGALGDEEATIIAPAIEAARAKGFNAIGPVPADVIFFQTLEKQYDAVVAMYHDQGLGPLKMHAFDCGVNLTLGLPIVRTSPDHGTAFDIAGKEVAKPDSMIAAIETAIQLAQRSNPWTT